jgi:hypothetical protein
MRHLSVLAFGVLFLLLSVSVYAWNTGSELVDELSFNERTYILDQYAPFDLENLLYTGFEAGGHKVYYSIDDPDMIFIQDGTGYIPYRFKENPHNAIFNISGCLKDHRGEKGVEVEVHDGTIIVERYMEYYCCAEMEMSALIEGNTIHIHTTNYGEVCRCMCNYRLEASITGLELDEYTVVLYDVMMEGDVLDGKECDIVWDQDVLIH